MNKKKAILIACGSMGITIIILCIILVVKDSGNIKIGFIENNLGNQVSASFRYFNGSKKKNVEFEEGNTITIKYSLTQESGILKLLILDEDGRVVDKKEGTGDGEINITVDKTQHYAITIEAKKAEGKYKVNWSDE